MDGLAALSRTPLLWITAASLLFVLSAPLILLVRAVSVGKLAARLKAGGVSSWIYFFVWAMTAANIAAVLVSRLWGV